MNLLKRPIYFSSIIIGFILMHWSCADQNNQTNEQNTIRQDSLNIQLNFKSYNPVILNPEADSLTREWPMYNNLKNEVERM
jgi:hypothetical protein